MTSLPLAAAAPCTSNDSSNDSGGELPYPPTRLPAIALLLALGAIAAGCGDDSAATGSGGGDPGSGAATATSTVDGTGGEANTAPALTGGNEIVLADPIPEGAVAETTVTLVDAEGDAFTTELTPGSFVDGTLDQGSLALHVGYRAEAELPTDGAAEILGSVVARDARGAEATFDVKGQVAPLGWSEHTEWADDAGPEAREHGTFLVDDASGSIYLMFGSGYDPYLEPLGDAWRFDVASKTWSAVEMDGDVPGPGGSKRLGGVRGSGEGWIYGGYGAGNAAYGGVYHVVADGDALHFEELEQVNPPGARLLHNFAYDPGTETFAMFGGGSSVLLGDTWTMQIADGAAVWTEIFTGSDLRPHPSPRFGGFSGMDEELGRLVLFSGQTSAANVFGDDTWILDMRAADGPTWTEVTPPEGPPGRRNGAGMWDPSAKRFFVFGGTSDGATTEPGLFAFDARPGHEAWTQVDRTDEPPLRSSCFGVYAEGAIWFGFGNSADGVFPDMTRLGS